MKRITVFCGSNSGNNSIYKDQAIFLGKNLASRGIGLVYGGASIGLMGAIADSVMAEGGQVIGVIPRFLTNKEITHNQLTQLIWVDSMHERKTKMFELGDGIIALPGGFGTLEEFLEILTWAQLGLHSKPVALLNLNGFYNDLISLTQKMVNEGFLKPVNQQIMLVSDTVDDLLEKMIQYKPVYSPKWINPETT